MRSKSVSNPLTPDVNGLIGLMNSIPETPPTALRGTSSVKEMLERVEQTLKKAGIANIIKGLKTYHTTPPHNNKTYDTLLRYTTNHS